MEKNYYKEYAKLETTHWWFTARINILKSAISKLIEKNKKSDLKILNVGVASGETSRMLEKFGNVTSVEYDKDCCEYLRSVGGIDVIEASLTDLPFEDNTFDMVCAFDVIEHIEDDQLAMSEIYRVLKPGGQSILTVPAYQFLWSEHDEINFHFRRYTSSQLKHLVKNKLEVDYISYFNFFLFPPIAFARLIGKLSGLRKSKDKELKSDFSYYDQSSIINKVFYSIFNAEKFLIGKVSFPFGVSILSVAHKKVE